MNIGSTIGSYEIVSPLGRGGMGEVYLARDKRLDRQVAIKVLPDALSRDPERVLRFEREAKLLASLNHTNIAAIHGFEEADDKRFLVLEYVDGETLANRLKRGPLPIDEGLEVGKQIAEAVEAAHAKGVVHRDLKPGNVMIGPDGRVKVLDFGLARAMSNESAAARRFASRRCPKYNCPTNMRTSIDERIHFGRAREPPVAYSKHQPDSRLAPFVEDIWVQESPADSEHTAPTTILPVGSSDLVVQFGDPFVRVDNGRETPLSAAHVAGQRTRPAYVRATGSTGLVVVRFRPWGASAFFDALEHFVDGAPDLGAVVGRHRADALVDAVQRVAASAERVRIVERFLLGLLRERKPDARIVDAALFIHRTGGGASVEAVAERTGTTRRHLARLFRDSIGIPPKMFARIVRFQRVAVAGRRGGAWCAAAQGFGYYDQAHLNHEFATFAGMSPSQFARRVSGRQLGRFFNSADSSCLSGAMYL